MFYNNLVIFLYFYGANTHYKKFYITNISYIQSCGYLYGHAKPCTAKRRWKPQKTCLYRTAVTAWKVSKYEVFSDPYFPVFRPEKLHIWTLFTQWVSRIGRLLVVKDMPQILVRRKPHRIMPRQRYWHSTHINLKKQQRWKTIWKFS